MEQLVTLLPLDVPDPSTGVIFPTAIIEDAVMRFNKRIEDSGGVLGECGLVQEEGDRFASIMMQNVSHVVKHMWIDNGLLMAKIKLIGKYADLAEEIGAEFVGAPRAFGDIDHGPQQKVCTEYTIITVDIELGEVG